METIKSKPHASTLKQKNTLDMLDFGCPLPNNVHLEWASKSDWESLLCADEEIYIQNAALKRQREFRAGRNTAHRAMYKLCEAQLAHKGLSKNQEQLIYKKQAYFKLPINVGESRQPLWPLPYVGSITHSQATKLHSCAVVTGFQQDIASIGIDIEPLEALPEDAQSLIITPNELQRSARLYRPVHWEKYIFAAKESFFKCLFPLTGIYLDFLEAEFEMIPIDASGLAYKVNLAHICPENYQHLPVWIGNIHIYVAAVGHFVHAVSWLDQTDNPLKNLLK